ncbi:MAG: FAD-dependent oxidoreductase [Christensenellales bacterium]|jgi:2-enoate reductase
MAQLFEKNMIGGVELKNRLGMGPMGFGHTDADGAYSDRQIDYYAERAKGGYALIYPTATKVCSKFEPSPFPNILQDAHHGTKLSMICDIVHQYGGKVCSQLSIGLGRVGIPYLDIMPKSASAVSYFWDPSITCEPYTVEEIKFLVDEFGKSALLAKNAGVDFIEMHAYGGYLIDQFISEVWNKRDDEYGGSLENRLRIVYEIQEAVCNYCGPDMPLIIKLTPEHGFEGGRTLAEGIEMLKVLDDKGFAAFHLDYGTYESWYNAVTTVYQQDGNQLFMAEAAKKAGIKTPLIVQGKLADPPLAKKVIEEGTADFILHGHPSLADPHWPVKVKKGRDEDICPCIGCNECIYAILMNRHSTCAVNPLCGMEKDYALTPATEKKDVLIIGGGPAGAMAAITAAQRGFSVELWEKEADLGGALVAAAAPDFKLSVKRYVDYLRTQVNKLNIKVLLDKEASTEDILARKPDTVILAAGSHPIIPKIDGIDKLCVLEATAMLKEGTCAGEKVVVLGGGLVGCEAALQLYNCGKDVTIVELLDDILLTVKHSLNNDQALRKMIADSNIKVLTKTCLVQGTDDGVIIEKDGKQETIPCDTLVAAVGYVSNRDMEEQLQGKIDQVITIGDNLKPAKVIDAVSQGYHTARLLEQLD